MPETTSTTSNVNLEASQQGVPLRATIPFAVIAVIAVACRFISRKIQSCRYEFDDYMIVIALICTLGCFTLSMEMVHYGSGKHLAVIPPTYPPQYLKCLFAYEIIYGSAILSIKLSVLSLYRRIFSVPRFKLAANVVTAMCVAWWIALVLTATFSCKPINGFWDKKYTKSKCINTEHFFIGNAVANMGTDLIILALPLQKIWHLNMQRSQKIALSIIFMLGGLVVVASAVRLYTQFKVNDPDFTWAQNGTVIWSSIEPSMGVVSACLPTLRPLAHRFSPFASRVTRYAADLERKTFARRAEGYSDIEWPRPRPGNPDTSVEGPSTSISASQGNGETRYEDVMLHQIKVQKDLHSTSEAV